MPQIHRAALGFSSQRSDLKDFCVRPSEYFEKSSVKVLQFLLLLLLLFFFNNDSSIRGTFEMLFCITCDVWVFNILCDGNDGIDIFFALWEKKDKPWTC